MSTVLLLLLACTPDAPTDGAAPAPAPAAGPRARTLTLAGYTTPREAYGKAILPAFAKSWKEKTGEDVTFEESYQGSGAQARAVKEGFEADVFLDVGLMADVFHVDFIADVGKQG